MFSQTDQSIDRRPLADRAGPYVSARCRDMGADCGAVDHLDLAVVRGADGIHQPVPLACLSPSHEAVVAGGARPIAFRQVAPRRAGSQYPEDAVQQASVIDAGHTSGLVGQQRLDHAPLEVGQVVSAHGGPKSVFAARRKLVVPVNLHGLAIHVRKRPCLRALPRAIRPHRSQSLRSCLPALCLQPHDAGCPSDTHAYGFTTWHYLGKECVFWDSHSGTA